MTLSPDDLEDLAYAKSLLENPSLAARITAMVGKPVEAIFDALPPKLSDLVNKSARVAIQKALEVAILTLEDRKPPRASTGLHKILATGSGVVGGAFGLASIALELPISTTIMLRSIADIARSEGEQIKTIDAQLACVEVFALGGRNKDDDAGETGYFAIRASLASAVTEAAQYITRSGLSHEGAPAIVRLISRIASRFGVTVSEKIAAQAAPVFGAVGGGVLNWVFMDHFQDMARGHFIVRRLERKYGPDLIQATYASLQSGKTRRKT